MLLRLACLGAGSLLASSAYAQFYLGGGVGQGHASLPSSSASIPTALGTVQFSGSGDKSNDTSYKLYGGYQFTPNWGVEIGYDNLGNSYSARGTGTLGALSATLGADYKIDNWYVAGTGTLPVGGGFSFLGKLGVVRNHVSASQICGGGICVPGSSDNHTDLLWGVGAQYAFMPAWAARLEYENYGKVANDPWGTGGGDLKAGAWYLSVNYSF